MLGKTKMDGAQKEGAKLQAKNTKWYRGVAQVQVLVFAAMHLILGMYFAFVSSVYANNPGFTAKIEVHRNLDQIFAIICFVLFALWLSMFGTLRKWKQISVVYYVGMIVSAVLPFAYMMMSGKYIADAMMEILTTGYPDLIVDGVGNANEIAFWTGIEYGAWINGAEITSESQIVLDYLSKIGVENGAEIELAKFDLGGLLAQFRIDMYSWHKFEMYAVVNAAVSAVFVICTAIFVPLKKLTKK